MITHSRLNTSVALSALALGVTLSSCGEPEPAPELQTQAQALNAFCEVTVQGVGVLEVETDYLPHVIMCENGAADFEALKAQAVSARSYAYYKLNNNQSLIDGQGDQVYTCGRAPRDEHYRAVAETAGQVLRYEGTYVAAFYVAGAIPSTNSCVPAAGDNDPTNTERYVTYNEGRSGDNLEQTNLGWVHPSNYANRGCMSQNGSHCLAEHGWNYADILRFYYGEDITLEQTEGRCVDDPVNPPVDECEAIPAEGGVLDEDGACFDKLCVSGGWWWWRLGEGWDGDAWYTGAIDDAEHECLGTWELEFEAAGDYRLEAYVIDGPLQMTERARYVVEANGVSREVRARHEGAQGWIDLGEFYFARGGGQRVQLFDNTGEARVNNETLKIIYDALRLTPVEPPPPVDAAPPPVDAAPPVDARPVQDMAPIEPPVDAATPPPPVDAAPPPPPVDAATPPADAPVTPPPVDAAPPVQPRPDAGIAPPVDAAPHITPRPDAYSGGLDGGIFSPAHGEETQRVRQTARGCGIGGGVPSSPWLLLLYPLLSVAYRRGRRSARKP